jgi:hypothetical protein
MAFASPVERELASVLMLKDDDVPANARKMIDNIKKMTVSQVNAQRVLKMGLLKRLVGPI